MLISELSNLSARDFIENRWGTNVLDVIDRQDTTPMTMDQFLDHCTACGGNWGAMLLTGIKALYPEVYDAIPDNMGHFAWRCLCEVLELLKIKEVSL